MHIPSWSIVLQAYVHKMAQCLLDISDDSESKSLLDLQRYSLEMAACFICCWMTSAHKASAAVTESLSLRDELCSLQQEGLPNKLYQDLLVNATCNVWFATALMCFWCCTPGLYGAFATSCMSLHTPLHTQKTHGQADRQAGRQAGRQTDTVSQSVIQSVS